MSHIVMLAYYILTVIQRFGDIRGGIDDLITVGIILFQTIDEGLLEFLRSNLLDSLVLHVVGKDETGITHPFYVKGGKKREKRAANFRKKAEEALYLE